MRKVILTAAAGLVALAFAGGANAQSTMGTPTGTGGASNQSSTQGTMDKQTPQGSSTMQDSKMQSNAMNKNKTGNGNTGMGQGKPNETSK